MRSGIVVALFLALLWGSAAVRADGFSVGQLLTNCSLGPGAMQPAKEKPGSGKQATFTALAQRLTCLAYIQGAMDMHAVTFGRFGKSSRIYCADHNVTVKEAADTVRRWAEKSPARLKLPAALGRDAALRETYSCEGK